jgi:thiol-disulfide isomerase/thioredoxin
MTRTLSAVSAAVLALLAASCAYDYDRSKIIAVDKRLKAPVFSLEVPQSQPVRLEDYKGKVVLLNFWATWCGPCRQEIPWLVSFQQQYKDQGFSVVGVSLDEYGWDAVGPYAKSKNINYPLAIGTPEVRRSYGDLQALPTTFMIDQQGRIAAVHVGMAAKQTYQEEIVALLNAQHDDQKKTGRVPVAAGHLAAVLRPR